jgi:poly(hydroxyalkanoate) depolymerase family esterase
VDNPLAELGVPRPGLDPLGKAPASADPLAPGQFLAGSFSHPAGTRAYRLYVPAAARGQPLPLVVMLHGCTQTPADFAAGTRLNALAEEYPCLVLYPAQAQTANAAKCWNWFNAADQQREQGEPALLAALTQEIVANYPVDTARVFVAGLSAGGAMAVILATTYPERYAAVAVHSGVPYGAAQDLSSAFAAMKGTASLAPQAPRSPKPILVFHGDRDATVHPANGEQLLTAFLPPQTLVQTRQEPARPGQYGYTHTRYEEADGRTAAEHWLVHGAGHAWFGGSPQGSYTDAQGPDASREMLRFFASQRLPDGRRAEEAGNRRV